VTTAVGGSEACIAIKTSTSMPTSCGLPAAQIKSANSNNLAYVFHLLASVLSIDAGI
jgi:hypothetical protein